MQPSRPSRIADQFWLAAHDSGDGRPCIGERPLGVGLAAALFAELISGGFLLLRDGQLVRTAQQEPSDHLALGALLTKMAEEEYEQQNQSSPGLIRATVRVQATSGVALRDTDGQRRPLRGADGRGCPSLAGDHRELPSPPAQDYTPPVGEAGQHRQRPGHPVGKWISYLKYRRAEDLMTARLARSGLARREQRRGLFGAKVRYVPWDSNVAGTPAISIITTLRHGERLEPSQLILVGLFLATGLDQHALATLTSDERLVLERELFRGLSPMFCELLRAAEIAVGSAAIR
ncbi:GPP34 family phosphoprotein [Paractinoplanes rhizophilus]|uniref:GPP34 family phosphoprotein n=1 Tax=Paractinoplanes rhizophilus TaxID=1416877 RepID=A0ABW2I414_9ACTN